MNVNDVEKSVGMAVEHVTQWNGFDVYGPKSSGSPAIPVGMVFFLVKGDKVQQASNDEFFAILDSLPD